MTPGLKEFLRLAKEYSMVPVWSEVVADEETPLSAYRKIVGDGEGFLLESVEAEEQWGRYSFIGFDPDIVFLARAGRVEIHRGRSIQRKEGSPLELLRGLMSRQNQPLIPGLPRFAGGAVGFFSYDVVRHIEDLPRRAKDDLKFPDAHFFIGGPTVIFDRFRQSATLLLNVPTAGVRDLRAAYEKAVQRLAAIRRKLESDGSRPLPAPHRLTDPKATAGRTEFQSMVRKAKNYIMQGDVIQVVLSRRLEYASPPDPFTVYRALRLTNPSPYMFYLNFGGRRLMGSSPEILVRLEGDCVTNRPIAGTRPRGNTVEEDLALEEQLKADPKERAEHIMLVDLARNDVGRVARENSVKVTDLMTVERYSSVMHLVSNVEGRLRAGRNSFDVFSACFPAGTVTGAPKVRAMEIIEELEPMRRGFYAGSVGYFGFSGNMDMCITIRSFLHQEGRCFLQVGAGIVSDSDPIREFQETVNKSLGMRRALDLAARGLVPA